MRTDRVRWRTHRVFLPGIVTIALAAGGAALRPAYAIGVTCPSSYKQWTQTTAASAALASIPVQDTAFSPVFGRSRSYFTQGTELFTVYDQNYPQGCTPGTGPLCAPTGGTCMRLKGCKLATWTTTPASTLTGAPNVVPSSHDTGKEYLFLGADNGQLYRVDVTGEPPYPTIAVDTRRSSCFSDKLIATPAVQLYNFANPAFRNEVDSHGPARAHDDVVIVITHNSCGDVTRNRVIAYWASDLSVKPPASMPGIAPARRTRPAAARTKGSLA